MKLLFDIGNTRIKAARFENGSLHPLPSITHGGDAAFPDEWQLADKPEAIWVASVASDKVVLRLGKWAHASWGCELMRAQVEQGVGGLNTSYHQPQQLGVDRWLAALGAYHLAEQKGVCVIDAGTALTVDLVDDSGVHLGGLIAPGIELMIESLTKGTAQLALENISVPDIFATDTQSAISLGCADYVVGMIERVNQRIMRQNLNIHTWYLTGGQGELVNRLSTQNMQLIPELVLHGLAIVAEQSA